MKNLISHISKAAVMILVLVMGVQVASAKDICANALYNSNTEAQKACPQVCANTNATFNGQWTNRYENVSAAGCKAGAESVCGSNVGDICAGVAFGGNDQAQQECPAIVKKVRTFNGNWTNNPKNVEAAGCRVGAESVCGCG